VQGCPSPRAGCRATPYPRPMLRGNFWLVSLFADGGSGVVDAADKSAGLNWQAVASGLIGGLVVAVANHLFTSRRERGKWLRELQVKANQEFFSAAQAFIDYVIDGNVERPLTPLGAVEGSGADEISKLRTAFNRKGLDLIPVARESTLEVARKATRLLPRLAYLAVPLTKTHHQAAELQRSQAITQMSAVLENVGAVMRDEVGLIGWRQRHAVKNARQSIEDMVIECDVDTDDPLTTLRNWGVRALVGTDVPGSLDGYRLASLPVSTTDDGDEPQGFAAKYRDHFWQFGMLKGLPPAVEAELLADAIRVITGHIHGYDMKHGPEVTQPVGGQGIPGVAFVWRRIPVAQPTEE
jgi:hypothetical protein